MLIVFHIVIELIKDEGLFGMEFLTLQRLALDDDVLLSFRPN